MHEVITSISEKEKLSQSKVVGILVEEALRARGIFNLQITNDVIRNSKYKEQDNLNNSSLDYSEIEELISDKGITYNTKKYKNKLSNFSIKTIEGFNQDLFEQFKQFIMFQRMKEEVEENINFFQKSFNNLSTSYKTSKHKDTRKNVEINKKHA